MANIGGVLSVSQEIDFVVIAFISIISGFLSTYSYNRQVREYTGAFIGVAVIVLFCGPQAKFIYFSVGLTILWKIAPVWIQSKTTTVIFAIMILSRGLYGWSLQLFGLPTADYTVANTIHMFVTLRCLSVMFEIMDQRNNDDEKRTKIAPARFVKEPSPEEMVSYLLHVPGICLGPFYTYKTYKDSMEMSSSQIRSIPRLNTIIEKSLIILMLHFCVYLIKSISGEILMDNLEEFRRSSHLHQYFHMICKALLVSCSIYTVFKMGECTCIAFGLGAYRVPTKPGQGPVDPPSKPNETWNFDTIYNGRGEIWFAEVSFAELSRNWNRTVQWFFMYNVFTSSKLKSFPRYVRYILVQSVNAMWHGCGAGYYVTLLSFLWMDTLDRFYISKTKNLTHFNTLFFILGRIIIFIILSAVMIAFNYTDLTKVIIIYSDMYKPMGLLVILLIALGKFADAFK